MASFFLKLTVIGVVLAGAAMVQAAPQARRYQLRLQPELDSINVDDYLKNEKLVELQVQCVIYDGPCDAVGRWIKPRVPGGFIGQCPMCTEKQQANVAKILKHFQEKRPEAYNIAVVNFLREGGVDLNGLSRALSTVIKSAPGQAQTEVPVPVVALAAESPAASVAALTAEPTVATTPEVGTTVAIETATV